MRYQVVSFGEYLSMAMAGQKVLDHLAVITIDDGYRDFYQFGFPELRKRGLEATFFVTVNFLNRKVWLWPDRLDYAIKNTRQTECDIHFEGRNFKCSIATDSQREIAWRALTDWGIAVSNEAKWQLIRSVETHLGVIVPDYIPNEYAPVSWGELREMSEQGIEIGSHTMNHPILSKILPQQLYDEIYASKAELETKLGIRVGTFCYPNSAPGDIDERVVRHVRNAGYRGAVFGVTPDFPDFYHVPRISLNSDLPESHWKIGGMEMFLQKYFTRC
ncbi:hypothetical protein DSLASN_27260 [Desulfoluna limicola]|uniref:NodB homology domain-containing protein n=2 Tax=Desulfoluna limicola TaxID=2810562 RepID=A0ABM7PIM2_9BACT|nr:hypothetical protein DSLASN_27260 [Desulfoluna limicola]